MWNPFNGCWRGFGFYKESGKVLPETSRNVVTKIENGAIDIQKLVE
jgi:hypothetical protein